MFAVFETQTSSDALTQYTQCKMEVAAWEVLICEKRQEITSLTVEEPPAAEAGRVCAPASAPAETNTGRSVWGLAAAAFAPAPSAAKARELFIGMHV